MPTAVVILSAPEVKSGNGAKGAWTLTNFPASDGRKYQTFEGALASKAGALLGQPVKVSYEEKKNGQYTNYDLKGVEAAEEGSAVQTAPPSKEDSYRTKEQILYSTALGVAVSAFGHAGLDPVVQTDDLYQLADEFYAKLQSYGA